MKAILESLVIAGPGSGDGAWRTSAEQRSALASRLCIASRLIALTTTLAAAQDTHYGPACHEESGEMEVGHCTLAVWLNNVEAFSSREYWYVSCTENNKRNHF
jgi:hypothetical protein